ncbi:MAG: ABC transporter ATP-binding protein [Microbacterium sp.]
MAGTGKAHLRPEHPDRVLVVEDLVIEYPVKRGVQVHAVSGISFDIVRGETLGLVGESGCGKSSTGRGIMLLPRPSGGTVNFENQDLMSLSSAQMRRLRPKIQMVFQDPASSLNPLRKVVRLVREPLDTWQVGKRSERDAHVRRVLDEVGIDYDVAAERRSREFSIGQCQRLSIARSLMLDPSFLICDEPVSSLDVSVQAQVLNLLEQLKAQYGLTMLFIAHDLAVVKNISDRVAVMYLGKLCEVAPPDALFAGPAHPYTVGLLSAIPVPDPNVAVQRRAKIPGEPPSPIDPPSGCRFRLRCPNAQERCVSEEPMLRDIGGAHFVACHVPIGCTSASDMRSTAR